MRTSRHWRSGGQEVHPVEQQEEKDVIAMAEVEMRFFCHQVMIMLHDDDSDDDNVDDYDFILSPVLEEHPEGRS